MNTEGKALWMAVATAAVGFSVGKWDAGTPNHGKYALTLSHDGTPLVLNCESGEVFVCDTKGKTWAKLPPLSSAWLIGK